jgi:hypothetical protein
VDSSIDEESVVVRMKIIESNASPAIECIVRELFRIYEVFCYRRSYGRGIGHPLNACPANAPDQSGSLCYPKCRDGYIGVGPVCWQDCAPLKAVGFFCVGSSTVQSLNDDNNHNDDTMTDSTGSYKSIFVRKSYGRGVGSSMICSSEYEQGGALCYDHCDKRYFGVGPVCWQYCPSFQPTSCGFGCSITSGDCAKVIIDMVTTVVGAIMSILRLKIVHSLIESITDQLITSAAKNDWISVAGNMSILSNTFAEKIISDISNKCDIEPFNTLESAMKNASLLLTVVAYNDIDILRPFLKLFNIDIIIKTFDHALCNLRDDFID